ncbi:MAG: DUF1972 domain-containing protein [Bacteroidales bacterium]|nr:DUF1972 domain-containing protein [Bacteroidales bacterium]
MSKLYIIGSAGIPARYGGFETFAENLAGIMSKKMEVYVACSTRLYAKEERSPMFGEAHRFFIDSYPNGISSLWYDLRSILFSIRRSKPEDTLLILGIGLGIFFPVLAPFFRGKIIVHLDGMEWQRSKWNAFARLFLYISRWLSLWKADMLIIDNSALWDSIPGRFTKKTALLGYGGDHIPENVLPPPGIKDEYALVIARAEPENQLGLILDAFCELPDIPLIVISNASQTRYGRFLLKKYGGKKNIMLKEAIYDKGLLQAYRSHCKLYLHGHMAGGTNPSLVEALYSKLKIIAADNPFNRVTTHDSAYYFNDKESLKQHIRKIFNNPYNPKGNHREIAGNPELTWKNVGEEFNRLIQV